MQLGPSDTYSLYFIVVAMFVLAFIVSGIRVLKEWERVAVLRLGKFRGVKGPGIIWVFPILDRVAARVSLRLNTYAFSTEQTLTKDNIPVTVDAVLYYKVIDPEKAILNVESYEQATRLAAQTSLRETIGKVSLDELLSEREKIGHHLQEIIDAKTEEWGIKVSGVEIRDVVIPRELQDAIARQAQAERERRARVILAQAEVEASQKMREAAKIYEESDIAFHLRWMNILYEVASKNSTIVLWPVNVSPAGVASPISIMNIPTSPRGDRKKKEGNL
ncbi:MAG: slipin family protein [Candidatus Odinarchaeota archaeon]|nr:slipin family protein [Candidatus Odinarchaeota archaeon]